MVAVVSKRLPILQRPQGQMCRKLIWKRRKLPERESVPAALVRTRESVPAALTLLQGTVPAVLVQTQENDPVALIAARLMRLGTTIV